MTNRTPWDWPGAIEYSPSDGVGFQRTRNFGWTGAIELSDAQWRRIDVGRHAVEVVVRHVLRHANGTTTEVIGALRGTFEVVPEDQPTVTMLKEPAFKQAVIDALQVVSLSRGRGTVALAPSGLAGLDLFGPPAPIRVHL